MHLTVPIVIAIVVANLVNAALNWMLIFGHLGAPAHGRAGFRLGHDHQPVAAALAAARADLAAAAPHLLPAPSGDLAVGAARSHAPARHPDRLPVHARVRRLRLRGADDGMARHPGRWPGIRSPSTSPRSPSWCRSGWRMPPRSWWVTRSAAAIPRRTRGAARAALLCGVGFMSCTAVVFLTVPETFARLYTDEASVLADRRLADPARRRVPGVRRHPDGGRRHPARPG